MNYQIAALPHLAQLSNWSLRGSVLRAGATASHNENSCGGHAPSQAVFKCTTRVGRLNIEPRCRTALVLRYWVGHHAHMWRVVVPGPYCITMANATWLWCWAPRKWCSALELDSKLVKLQHTHWLPVTRQFNQIMSSATLLQASHYSSLVYVGITLVPMKAAHPPQGGDAPESR